jgi:hypothetical protein
VCPDIRAHIITAAREWTLGNTLTERNGDFTYITDDAYHVDKFTNNSDTPDLCPVYIYGEAPTFQGMGSSTKWQLGKGNSSGGYYKYPGGYLEPGN